MAVATIWYRKEINALLQHYPDIKTIQKKTNKSPYRINRKAQELGILNNTKPNPPKKKKEKSTCQLWEQKRRSVSDIETDIEHIEQRIIKGLDLGPEWSNTIQTYNALQLELERALKKN